MENEESSKEQDSAASSTSAGSAEPEKPEAKAEGDEALSAKDIKRIKALFNEQEDEIKDLEVKLKAAEKKI